MTLGPALCRFSSPFSSMRKKCPVDDRERIAERVRRHGAADRDCHQKTADTSSRNTPGVVSPTALQHRDRNARACHEARIEHIDARHHAGTAVGAGPGLHGSKRRTMNRPPGSRARQIGHEPDAAPGAKERPISHRTGDRLGAKGRMPMSSANRPSKTAAINVGSR